MGGMRQNGDRLRGPCPIHGGDNPHAFVVTISKNLWFCFTGCRKGGDSVDLIARLDGCSRREALRRLERGTPAVVATGQNQVMAKPSVFRPFGKKLWLEPGSLFLKQKGITSKTALFFETGEYDRAGFLKDCIGIRLHDPVGTPLGYAGRRLIRSEITGFGKWKFPSGFPKKELLFNVHRTRLLTGGSVVVTECPWGVMRLHQLGIPAVALMGVHCSRLQLELLSRAKRVALMLDGDSAGIVGARYIAEKLRNQSSVRVINLPKEKDPDDLSDRELLEQFKAFPLF